VAIYNIANMAIGPDLFCKKKNGGQQPRIRRIPRRNRVV